MPTTEMNIQYALTLDSPGLSTHLPTSSWACWDASTRAWLMGWCLILRAAKFARHAAVPEALLYQQSLRPVQE